MTGTTSTTTSNEPPLHATLRSLRDTLGITLANISGYGPVIITLGSDVEVEAVGRYYRQFTQRVSQDRIACGVKLSGVRVQFVGDKPATGGTDQPVTRAAA